MSPSPIGQWPSARPTKPRQRALGSGISCSVCCSSSRLQPLRGARRLVLNSGGTPGTCCQNPEMPFSRSAHDTKEAALADLCLRTPLRPNSQPEQGKCMEGMMMPTCWGDFVIGLLHVREAVSAGSTAERLSTSKFGGSRKVALPFAG